MIDLKSQFSDNCSVEIDPVLILKYQGEKSNCHLQSLE